MNLSKADSPENRILTRMRFQMRLNRYKPMFHGLIENISQTKSGAVMISVIGFIYPISVGIVAGETATQLADWKHPVFVYVAAGLLAQIIILLLKNWFSERRELLEHAERMRKEQAEHYEKLLERERETTKVLSEQLQAVTTLVNIKIKE